MGLTRDGLRQLWANIVVKLDTKVDKVEGKGLSTNDFTTAEKEKLSTLQNVIIDTALSDTSNNPVANSTITEAIAGLQYDYSKTIIAMSVVGNTIIYHTGDGKEHEMDLAEYGEGTPDIAGLTKLYNATGQNTDGTMTQKAITDELNKKLSDATITDGTLIITK